jgi:uncharacterized protein (TIGR02598 family)
MKFSKPTPPPSSAGFTLTEVIIALGLFVFAITALMGVIPYGMNQVQTASNESRALAVLEAVRDDIKLSLQTEMDESPTYKLPIPTNSGDSDIDLKITESGEKVTGNQLALFRIEGTLRSPQASTPDPIFLNLRATWPPNARPGKETGSVELVAAFKP